MQDDGGLDDDKEGQRQVGRIVRHKRLPQTHAFEKAEQGEKRHSFAPEPRLAAGAAEAGRCPCTTPINSDHPGCSRSGEWRRSETVREQQRTSRRQRGGRSQRSCRARSAWKDRRACCAAWPTPAALHATQQHGERQCTPSHRKQRVQQRKVKRNKPVNTMGSNATNSTVPIRAPGSTLCAQSTEGPSPTRRATS